MWREMIEHEGWAYEPASPASDLRIGEVQEELGLELHSDLRGLLLETDGLRDEYGAETVWSIDSISDQNRQFRESREFRELYMSFESLLFFGDYGNGDQFAYPIQDRAIRRSDVFIWNHEDDSRMWVASNLRALIGAVARGEISA